MCYNLDEVFYVFYLLLIIKIRTQTGSVILFDLGYLEVPTYKKNLATLYCVPNALPNFPKRRGTAIKI